MRSFKQKLLAAILLENNVSSEAKNLLVCLHFFYFKVNYICFAQFTIVIICYYSIGIFESKGKIEDLF